MSTPRFASVVLDVDSTLCSIEGIDWLAERRDPVLAAELRQRTNAAMAGEIPLESIYADRLERIRPSATDIAALAEAYRAAVAPEAATVISRLRDAGVAVQLVSGGIRQAIAATARDLDFDDVELHAVGLYFDGHGGYRDFDRASPLATAHGKCDVVRAIGLTGPILAVGDGSSDAELREVVQAFAAFTGFVRRGPVVALATHECHSFDDILGLVLP